MVDQRGRVVAWVLRWLACALVAGILSLPWAVESAVEHAAFDDRVGTLPVTVGLAHNGYTTLDTGLFGRVYWRRTSVGGFGAVLRSTGPPLAGGTLASYVSPEFVRANTRFLEDPEAVATVYAARLRHEVVVNTAWLTLTGGVLGGVVLTAGSALLRGRPRRSRRRAAAGVLAASFVISVAVAIAEFTSWSGDQLIGDAYGLPGHPDLSFSSPQAREIAEQVQPFIEKNTSRIRDRADEYQRAATASLRGELDAGLERLTPRPGERIVLAEADPQGSLVGTRVRRELYAELQDRLPDDALAVRTIAGDLTSNGTVAEAGFVEDEAEASPGVPVVAAKGDHDTSVTVEQLLDAGVTVPDTEVVDVGGLRLASARDPAFKALFGGLVVNETGTTESEIGAALRGEVDADMSDGRSAFAVLLHQPRAAQGYLGVSLEEVEREGASLTEPVDDGIANVPPGIVTYGHLHDDAGPWVVWNTDRDEVTWTVVTQLGTAGGVEENPTFNRFSTPFSAPLKALSLQLQYVNPDTGLQTGLVRISIATDGSATIGDRIDVGLPDGKPRDATDRARVPR